MKKKPIMTLEDHLREEAIRIAKMSEEERNKYFEELASMSSSDNMFKGVVSLDEVLESDEEIPYVTLDNIGSIMAKINNDIKFKHISRDGKESKRRSKIYFTAHYNDYQLIEPIASIILKEFNVDIYYYDNFNDNLNNHYLEQLLTQMDLFIVPITNDFLTTNNRAFNIEIQIATDYGINLLPIYFNGSINEFNQKLGNYELLIWDHPSFMTKFYKFLDTIFVRDELYRRIEQEFIGKIFLSYRKKDLVYALSLIDLIQSNKTFYDLAIWYDDFLTPGENFDEEIKQALKDADVFALLITPNLLGDNYVKKEEYPEAIRLQKQILPVEVLPTKYIDLKHEYNELNNVISIKDPQLLNEALKALLEEQLTKRIDSAKHRYYIGLAYYYGINVIKNIDVAIQLISSAAEEYYILAIHFLATKKLINNETLINLIEIVIPLLQAELDNNNLNNLDIYFDLMNYLVLFYITKHQTDKAINYLNILLKYNEFSVGRKAEIYEKTARLYYRLSVSFKMSNDLTNFSAYVLKAKNLITELFTLNIVDKPYTLYFLIYALYLETQNKLAKDEVVIDTYNGLVKYYQDNLCLFDNSAKSAYYQMQVIYINILIKQNKLDQAIHLSFMILNKMNELEPDGVLYDNMSQLLVSLATIYFNRKQLNMAISMYKKAITFVNKITGYDQISINYRLVYYINNLAYVLYETNQLQEVNEQLEIAYNLLINNSFPHHKELMISICQLYTQVLLDLKDYENVIVICQTLINYLQKIEEKDEQVNTRLADSYYRIGYIYKTIYKNDELAKEYFKEALAVLLLNNDPNEEIIKALKQLIN